MTDLNRPAPVRSGASVGIGCAVWVAVAWAAPTTAADTPPVLIEVEVVKAPVFWTDNRNDKEGKPLTVTTTEPHKLAAGKSWVRCGPGGVVRVRRPTRVWQYDKPTEDWIPIVYPSNPKEVRIRAAHGGELFTKGGVVRGAGDVYAPVRDSLVSPPYLTIRWVPERLGVRAQLSVREDKPGGEPIWGPTVVDGAAGVYRSVELQDALAKWRADKGGLKQGTRLVLVYDAKGKAEVPFDVMTPERELQLADDLRGCEEASEDLPTLSLNRAAVFRKYGLLPEAAEECRLAAARDPISTVGRTHAAWMYRALGDDAAAKQLESVLMDQKH